MTLKEQIKTDFMSAFKARQMEKKNFLGLIKSAIETEEKNTGNELTDVEVTKILKKFAKSLNESIKAGSTEQMVSELEIVESYLPTQMSEEQITSIVETLIANGASNMGQIMGTFNKEYAGQADNKLVSQIARQKLA